MNYLSNFLNWSEEPGPNNANQQHQNEYTASPLQSLQKLDSNDGNNQSQQTSIASALFSGWHSTSSQQHNVSLNWSNNYNNKQYNIPSITSQQQPNNIIPPSYPSAIAVTASPPPPMIGDNNTHRNSAKKNQVKFTPNYKKKRFVYGSDNDTDSDTDSKDSYDTNDSVEPADNKSTSLGRMRPKTPETPPPRAPMTFTKPILSNHNSEEYAKDIVRPHSGYSNNSQLSLDKESINQSTTQYVNMADEMADAASNSNLMVSILDGDFNDVYDAEPGQPHNINNYLVPAPNSNNNSLPIIHDADVDADEVNLLLYGIDFSDKPTENFETASVGSDFEEAGIYNLWLKPAQPKKQSKSGKIRVTCNNCYKFRHYTNKLEIEISNSKERMDELEQSINCAQSNEEVSRRHCDEVKEENERLKCKNNELKREISSQQQELTQSLIESRKKKESETTAVHKEYQNLMKQKNELELAYNEQVNICNIKEAEIEKYKNEIRSMQFKHDRLDNDILQERITLNLKEKSMTHNSKEKCSNLKKENEFLLQNIEQLTNENNKYKIQHENNQQFVVKNDENEKLLLDLRKYKDKSEILSSKLQKRENELFELNNEFTEMKQINEAKLKELRHKINNFCDELTEAKDENLRLLKIKTKENQRINEIEEQLKRTNGENDKLMDQKYELNEKLNKKIEEMDEYKRNLYAINCESSDFKEEIKILSTKLLSVTSERDKQLKKNVRLCNRINSLQNENSGLSESIQHLESIIDDTYQLQTDKDRKLNKLKRENNENQLSLDRLKNKMKKHERYDRQKTSYRNLEFEWGTKSHRKMDQKLDKIRKSNVKLQNENDEFNQQNKQLNININELTSQLNEGIMKLKSTVSKYESDLSQIKAENHKISADKINSQTDLEIVREENLKLLAYINELNDTLRQKKCKCLCDICIKHPLQCLIQINIENDEKYQFINRCRNIFVNTNKLTPKLIMQLIESCHHLLSSFHEIKTKFHHFINKSHDITEIFCNVQQNILTKYTKTGIFIPFTSSMLPISPNSPNSPQSPQSPKSPKTFSNYNGPKSPKRNSVIHKAKINMSQQPQAKLRKPIQGKKPIHYDAYFEIYKLLMQNVTNGRHDMECVSVMYAQALDYSSYEFDEKQQDKNENEIDLDVNVDVDVIDYDTLLIHPSSQRYQAPEMEKNNEKFIAAISKFKASSKELRTLNAKSSVELDVAWHSYYLSATINTADNDDEYDVDCHKTMVWK